MKSSSILAGKVYVEAVHAACNRRKLDAQKVATFFEDNGYRIVRDPRDADVMLLITCAVSLEREANSISRIHNLKKLGGELIVSGCLPAINKQKLSAVHSGVSIPTSELSKLDDYFPNMQVKFTELGDANRYWPSYEKIFGYQFFQVAVEKIKSFRRLPLNYIIKKEIPRLINKMIVKRSAAEIEPFSIRISWGCNHQCAYCGIRSAVGKLNSKPLETCREEFIDGLNRGYKEFELIADDVGAYGIDIGQTFPILLDSLFKTKGEYKMQIWNLSPVWLIKYQEDFGPILKKNRISGIHYPVQSGSNTILKAMNRYSNVNKIRESVLFLKHHSPRMVVTTDIIIGYPGETEDDIDKTIDFLRQTHFDSVHIFMYNDVPNTIAYSAGEKIPFRIAEQRVSRLQQELKAIGGDYLVIV
jgi:tRNA A37 methylthiotransferase MiaB